jgi:hypothetical protein
MTTTTQTTDVTGTMDRLERETCSRCGGTGQHSYCPQYGTTCFKCSGRKEVLTKRGYAANLYLTALRSRRADALQVGDQIHYESMTMGGEVVLAWYTIKTIAIQEDGRIALELTSRRAGPLSVFGMAPDKMVRVVMTPEQKAETLAQAIAFQATLTKQGKPRVVRG